MLSLRPLFPVRHNTRHAAPVTFERLEGRQMLSLLGVTPSFPLIQYDATGTLVYNAAAETLSSDATPLSVRFDALSAPRTILSPRDFQLAVRIDSAGALLGGVAGDDLLITGEVDADGDTVIDYSGVLLSGEILAYGSFDSTGTTDQHDFRFEVTGGALASLFSGKDIGVRLISASSTFNGTYTSDFTGRAQGQVGPIDAETIQASASLAGRVYHDADNDGHDDGQATEAGIDGVTVRLTGTDANGDSVDRTTVTSTLNGVPGSYAFEDLVPGTYTLTEVDQPASYLDGGDEAGDAGGAAGNDVISAINLAANIEGTGYNFGEILPGSITGIVFLDVNDDGELNFSDQPIPGATVTLTGTDDLGQSVNLTTLTDNDGAYVFNNLRPGTYTVTEQQPAAYLDGQDTVGTLGGLLTNDQVSLIVVDQQEMGAGYDFGEIPTSTDQVHPGQTATIGYWQNKNGQALVRSLNGGAAATQLGDWLGATLPNIFGVSAGANNLTGKTNGQVADFYLTLFAQKGQKLDAQVMGVALATYVTSSGLAGNTAAAYGFEVTATGLGSSTFNVGLYGAAFSVANNTTLTVMQILKAADDLAVNGLLYNGNKTLRDMANVVFTAINESGDI